MVEAFIARAQGPGGGAFRRVWLTPDGPLKVEGEQNESRPLKILRRDPGGLLVVLWGEEIIQGVVNRQGSKTSIHVNATAREITFNPAAVDQMEQAATKTAAPTGSIPINSPIPGLIKGIPVKVGDEVQEGQTLLILEAMKMENEIPAPHAGSVEAVCVESGKSVTAGELLLTLKI